jgi:hypothetical protein
MIVKYSIPCYADHPKLNSKVLPSERKRRQEESRGGEKKLNYKSGSYIIGYIHIKYNSAY